MSAERFGGLRAQIAAEAARLMYEESELRFRPRSSTDGKPIVRVRASALESLLASAHADDYQRYLETGLIAGLDERLDDEGADESGEPVALPGPYDGLLDGAGIDPDEEPALPEPGEEEDSEQLYEPLPGFEATG